MKGGIIREVIVIRSKQAGLIAGVSLLLAPNAVLAHHALQAQFDTEKTITLTGTVTKIDWSNPHVRLYLDVKGEKNMANWELDLGSPNLQMMKGWKTVEPSVCIAYSAILQPRPAQ
jgi:hypothetical protein